MTRLAGVVCGGLQRYGEETAATIYIPLHENPNSPRHLSNHLSFLIPLTHLVVNARTLPADFLLAFYTAVITDIAVELTPSQPNGAVSTANRAYIPFQPAHFRRHLRSLLT